MPFEIERKFLVRDDGWKAVAGPGQQLCQGYIAQGEHSHGACVSPASGHG
jgi:CYTH domain-containing protein